MLFPVFPFTDIAVAVWVSADTLPMLFVIPEAPRIFSAIVEQVGADTSAYVVLKLAHVLVAVGKMQSAVTVEIIIDEFAHVAISIGIRVDAPTFSFDAAIFTGIRVAA